MASRAADVARGLWDRRSTEFRAALRVAIAGTLTFALARWFGVAQGYWAVITSVIVVQTSLGGSVKAAVERLLGTLAGALFGAAVGLLVPHGASLGLGTAVAVALAPLAYLAAVDQRFRVAPITALIVLLTAQASGSLVAALDRIVEIALGNLVGVAVSLLVLPARAHHSVLSIGAEIVEVQARLIERLLAHQATSSQTAGGTETASLQAASRSGLRRLEIAVDEAKRERQMHLSQRPDAEPFLRTLYRVRHDLVMVARATTGPAPAPLGVRIEPSLRRFAEAAVTHLSVLAAAMRGKAVPPTVNGVAEALADYAAAIEAARVEGLTRHLTGDAVGRVFALRFALEQLVADLHDLAERTGEFVAPA